MTWSDRRSGDLELIAGCPPANLMPCDCRPLKNGQIPIGLLIPEPPRVSVNFDFLRNLMDASMPRCVAGGSHRLRTATSQKLK
jgi:hypothetical protein